jgi:MinD superfamily P-loop ATPase
VAYLDCDVEEPNGGLFLQPQITDRRAVTVAIPAVDRAKCTQCGRCGEICQFSAIVPMVNEVLVFPELCHACGGCLRVCPAGAISETHRPTGMLETGRAGDVRFVQGELNVGEVMSPPVIAAVTAAAPPAELTIYDSPPGTSCPVIESIREADLVLLVTEPTPFGLNDLKLAVDMVRALELPCAVVVNRSDVGDGETSEYCRRERLDVLAELPHDRAVAEAYSRGELAVNAIPAYRRTYLRLLEEIERRTPGAPDSPGGATRE